MLTGELKNKVDKIWESFWTGGITNPLDVIEQFTYLMFIKQLDEVETKNEADAELFGMDYEGLFPKDKPYLRWHHFKDIGSADKMYQIMSDELFPFIKNLKGDGESSYARFMRDAIFKIPTANLLQKVVTGIEGLNTEEADIKGDLYEYLLNKLNNSGTNGQFRTPRHIINMMVNLVKPVPTDTICDPAMGTAGFLIGAEEYLREKHKELFLDDKLKEHFNNKMFNGFDMDSTMLRIGAMNLISHNVDNPQIEYRDSLSQQNIDENKYSLILANPPFKGSLDYILTRMKTPFHPAIMNIGEIHGGTARNSVAKETEFHGTVRCYSDEMFAHLTDSIGRINKGFEEAYGCRIEWSCPPFYPAVINDKKLFNYVSSITSLKELDEPLMLAEDFSFYQKEVKGLFIFVGTKTKEFQSGLHTGTFNFNESVLQSVVDMYMKIILNYQEEN